MAFRYPPIDRALEGRGIGPSSVWRQWFIDISKRFDASSELKYVTTTIAASALDSAGTVTIKTASLTDSWIIREVFLSGAGTNYAAGGDRIVSIGDSSLSNIITAIPAATLKSLAASRWGDTGTPYPATAADFLTATTVGENIIAKYTGGTTDYSATGSLTLTLCMEKVT